MEKKNEKKKEEDKDQFFLVFLVFIYLLM